MSIYQGRSLTKVTGHRIKLYRKKRKFELGRPALYTTLGKRVKKKIRCYGGVSKVRLYQDNMINLYNPKTKTIKRVKVLSVIENTANPHFARRRLITKGAIVSTEIGLARVTNRPGQDGIINGVLLKSPQK